MAKVEISFVSNTASFQRGLNEVNNSVNRLKTNLGSFAAGGAIAGITASLTNTVTQLSRQMASMAGGLIKSSSSIAANFETMNIQFEVLLGSAEKANKLFKQLQEYGAATPLQLKDIANSTKLLLQFGVNADEVMTILKQLGDISMGDAQKLQSLARAFGQASSSGRVMLEEINQMIDAGFNPLEQMAKNAGVSVAELRKNISDGNVSIDQLKKAMTDATSSGGQFNNMLGRISETTQGKLSNLSDIFDQLKAAFGTGFNVGIKNILDELNTGLPTLETSLGKLGIQTGNLLTALSEKVPDFINDIQGVLEGKSSIWDVISNSIARVLRSQEVKDAAKELAQSIFPEWIVSAGESAKAGGAGTTGALSIGALALGSMVGGRTSTILKTLGLGTGAYTITRGAGEKKFSEQSITDKVVQATASTVLYGSLMKILLMLPKSTWTNPVIAGGLLAGASGLTGYSLGEITGQATDNVLKRGRAFGPLDISSQEQSKLSEKLNKFIDSTTPKPEFGFKTATPEEANKIIENLRKSMLPVQQPLRQSSLNDYTLALAQQEYKNAVSTIINDKKPIQEASFEVYKPIVSSLQRIGGASGLTGETMPSLQKIANNFLEKIAKNTEKINVTPVWT